LYVCVVVQGTREEACDITATTPGAETSETDGGTATEERCCSEGVGDSTGEM